MRSARRSRRALIVALPVLLVGSLLGAWHQASSAVPLSTASPAPAYLSGLGTRFVAASNGSWVGAKALPTDYSSNPLNKPQGEHDPLQQVWAKSCGKKQQTATFKRTLELPGRPSEAELVLSRFTSSPITIKTFAVTVNSTKAASGRLDGASSEARVSLTAKGLHAFEDGKNAVVVKLVRSKLPAGMKKCNTSSTNQAQVSFSLQGDFLADLRLFEDEPPVIYRPVDEEGQASAQFHLTVRNDGPSGAVAGADFTILTSGVPFVVAGSGPTNPDPPPPFDTCTRSTSAGRFDCTLLKVERGDSGHVYVGMAHDFGTDQMTQHRATLTWRLFHPADPTLDERTVTIVFCGAQATDPNCAGV